LHSQVAERSAACILDRGVQQQVIGRCAVVCLQRNVGASGAQRRSIAIQGVLDARRERRPHLNETIAYLAALGKAHGPAQSQQLPRCRVDLRRRAVGCGSFQIFQCPGRISGLVRDICQIAVDV